MVGFGIFCRPETQIHPELLGKLSETFVNSSFSIVIANKISSLVSNELLGTSGNTIKGLGLRAPLLVIIISPHLSSPIFTHTYLGSSTYWLIKTNHNHGTYWDFYFRLGHTFLLQLFASIRFIPAETLWTLPSTQTSSTVIFQPSSNLYRSKILAEASEKLRKSILKEEENEREVFIETTVTSKTVSMKVI